MALVEYSLVEKNIPEVTLGMSINKFIGLSGQV